STRNLSEGKIICRQVLKDAKKRKYTNIEIEACDCLYKIHKERESYVDALFYHERKILLNDSLSVMKVKHALDINRKIAETDKLIAERELQKELSAKELKNQNIIIGLLMISTLLGLLFIGFLTKNQQRIRRKNKEINDKTNELLQANENLERSNEELERFAHIASHDLKTPLYNIIRFTSLLERRLKKYQDTELQEYFSFIKDGGLRMKNLIEDVLEYSKLTNIENRNIAQEVDLSGLCSELSNSISNYLQERQAIVEISTPLPVMNSNYSLLFRLFKNLVENAIKYNESATPMVKIYCVNHTDTFSILIEDNGIGIEEEYFEKIWEMFSRLHIQSKYEGTGLGLASCKKIMDTLEGEISLSSKVDEGTIFELRFPKSHLSKKSEDIQYA
ncbi:MAG: ATP-binding protein, partial [Saprospiraceae bacterium]